MTAISEHNLELGWTTSVLLHIWLLLAFFATSVSRWHWMFPLCGRQCGWQGDLLFHPETATSTHTLTSAAIHAARCSTTCKGISNALFYRLYDRTDAKCQDYCKWLDFRKRRMKEERGNDKGSRVCGQTIKPSPKYNLQTGSSTLCTNC